MKRFVLKLLKFASPLLIIFGISIGTFYYFDPFKVVYQYEEFKNSPISYNEDFIGTERMLRSHCQYDSYIFGSSRAGIGFMSEDWSALLPKGNKVLSYAASNETLFGINGKIRLIAEEGCTLKNALVIIDSDRMIKNTTNSHGHLYIKHPRVSQENKGDFVFEYLKDYIFTGFFIRHIDYLIFKKRRPYMKGFFFFDSESNQEVYQPFRADLKESLLRENVVEYYKKREKDFYARPSKKEIAKKLASKKSALLFKQMKEVFDKNKTNYKIIISPLYDQKKMAPEDLNQLIKIFSKEKVFDFSGKNQYTNDKINYFETSHFRPHVGKQILESIYLSKGHGSSSLIPK